MSAAQLNQYLTVGVQYGASDIHLKVGDPPMYRVNGTLQPLKSNKLRPNDTLEICRSLIEDPRIRDTLNELQEYDTSYSVAGVGRFRVNIFKQRGTFSAILRVIASSIPTLESLGLPGSVQKLASEERGLVLVTGATGSGKSTTLAAMIGHINRTRRVHVLTIEDPIEYLHSNDQASISQREIGLDTPNFTIALRAALRQDPDVILVGEMRDAETIDIALKAAETGHMVFSTVHTPDAAKTINRLLAVFPAEEQHVVRMRLAESLRGSVSQRLLRRKDGQGRVVAAEIMVCTKTVQEYIKDATKTDAIRTALEQGVTQYGMQSFDQHLTHLYKTGVIDWDTALAAATNRADFERNLHFQ
jgi:twitching motility protein PilT